MLRNPWQNSRFPDRYHGRGVMRRFFEGWYFKMTTRDGSRSVALIPGVFWGADASEHHSFLQVLDGKHVTYDYIVDRASAFSFQTKPFLIRVGENQFSFAMVEPRVSRKSSPKSPQGQRPATDLTGLVEFSNVVRWRDRWYSPGSMGFYNYIPHMQCYSQVCVVDATLRGGLNLNGETIDFTGGRGYVEKNWGRAFPYSWVWVQCSTFDDPSVTVNCSIGHVPMGPGSFRGHLTGVTFDNRFFAFTTMNRSALTIRNLGRDLELEFANAGHRLVLRTRSEPDSFILCRGPRDGEMVPMVWESLQGQVELELYDQTDNSLLVKSHGRAAGLEYGGEQMAIIDEDRAARDRQGDTRSRT